MAYRVTVGAVSLYLWRMTLPTRLRATLVLALLLAACSGGGTTTTTAASPTTTAPPATTTTSMEAPAAAGHPEVVPGEVGRWVPEILERRPHDPESFTQGFVIEGDTLYESAGLYGESSLQELDPETGEIVRSIDVDPMFFAEGLELVGDRLLQLTWREEQLIVWDEETFTELDRIAYEGEGWGLCQDDADPGGRLVMSDGSDQLEFRDPETFEVVGQIDVTLEGEPVLRLNELECVGGLVFANVWQTTEIVAIDLANGEVLAVVDATQLAQEALAENPEGDVLNGIAHDPAAGTFLLTGKLWPTMFEVRFVEG